MDSFRRSTAVFHSERRVLSAVHPLCADVRFLFCAAESNARLSAAARCVWLPAVYLGLLFPPVRTLPLQSDPVFCLSIAGYNWLGGGAASAVILCALRSDRRSSLYRQRRLVAVSILLPLWVWLVAAFPFHALGISNLSKIWQIELPVVLFILVFFLYHAFREGIWGMRLRRETYDWSGSRGEVLQRNTQYVAHALKNDLNKIDWCTALLNEQMPGNREVDIIRHSVEHLRALICRTKTHTDRVTLEPDFCDVRALFEQLIHETPHAPALSLEVAACDDAPLFCDKTHIHETLTNLISNASEAMRGSGRITLSYTHAKPARKAVISVSDNGPGMTPEQQKRIFEPYFTTKSSGENFGLGLYYCQNVMNAHGGSITVRSTPGEGSTFSLRFHSSPEERTRP